MIWAPEVSLVVGFLGVCFLFLCILLIPLVFSLSVLRLFASLFLTLALAFASTFDFSSSFTFSGGERS